MKHHLKYCSQVLHKVSTARQGKLVAIHNVNNEESTYKDSCISSG